MKVSWGSYYMYVDMRWRQCAALLQLSARRNCIVVTNV